MYLDEGSTLQATGDGTCLYIENNTASIEGGGLSLIDSSSLSVESGAKFYISHNTAGQGGGISLTRQSTLSIVGKSPTFYVLDNTATTGICEQSSMARSMENL